MYLPVHPESQALWSEWARCWPWLRRTAALAPTHDENDILATIAWTGRSQLWPAEDAVAVTEVITTPNVKVFNVWLAGGNLATLKAMFADMEAWGRSIGCRVIQIMGREGWQRALPGMTRSAVVLTKEL